MHSFIFTRLDKPINSFISLDTYHNLDTGLSVLWYTNQTPPYWYLLKELEDVLQQRATTGKHPPTPPELVRELLEQEIAIEIDIQPYVERAIKASTGNVYFFDPKKWYL